MTSLASQCSDSSAIEALVKTVFDVLNGSEGKLTVNSHKMSLFSAASALASSSGALSSAMTSIVPNVMEKFIKLLEAEAHEGTILAALESLHIWLTKFHTTNELPAAFVSWISTKALSLKTTTSSVKSAYLQCFYEGLASTQSVDNAKQSIPALKKVLENAAKQPAQVSMVTEGVHAVACILRASPEGSSNLDDIWKIVLDDKLALFTSDKFLNGADGAAMKSLAFVTEKILFLDTTTSDLSRWQKALIFALTHNESKARSAAASSVKRLGNVLGGQQTILQLAHVLSMHIWSNLDPDSNENLKVSSVMTGMNAIANGVEKEEANELSLVFLKSCHHPALVSADPNAWSRVCKRNLKLDPVKIIEKNSDAIVEAAIADIDQSGPQTLQKLVKINPDALVPKVSDLFMKAIKAADLNVSTNDYGVYLTPEGTVYDRTTIDNLKEGNESKNIKRESKAYSYKEQMEEIALRKEIEEKRRREGKLQEPKLTPKQKEAMANQLAKESEIRSRLTSIDSNLRPKILALASCLRGRPVAFASVLADGKFLPQLYRGIQCPLFTEALSEIVTDLRLAVFDNEEDVSLGFAIVATILSVVKEGASNKTSKAFLASALEKIYTSTIADEENSCPFTTPAFHLSFKIIQEAMWQYKDSDEDIVAKGLSIIDEHTNLRGSEQEESEYDLCNLDQLHPKYLPRKDILVLLFDLLTFMAASVTPTTTISRLAQTAVSTVISVCSCASGKPGCVRASIGEVDTLLSAVKSQHDVVRDAALRGLMALNDILVSDLDSLKHQDLVQRIWVAKHDPMPENRVLADKLWDEAGLDPYDSLHEDVVHDVVYPGSGAVRVAASQALAKCPQLEIQTTMEKLLELYDEKLETTPPVLDGLGRVVQAPIDHWEPREGIAMAIEQISVHFNDPDLVEKLANFLVKEGLTDRKEEVRKKMLSAAVVTVDHHGKDTAEHLLPVFEEFLDNAPKEHVN